MTEDPVKPPSTTSPQDAEYGKTFPDKPTTDFLAEHLGRQKPTIADIEKAMEEYPGGVEIRPDGSVHGVNVPETRQPDLEDAACKVQAKTVIVLHSGGIDSTTCLYMAVKAYGRENVCALSMHYGQRHEKELTHAETIAENLGVEHHIVKLAAELPMSMITNPDAKIPSVSYEELGEGVSPTYVPFRNGNLLSHVAAIAQSQGVSAIYFGAHAEDAHNWAYPDCTPEFIGAMANAIYIGTYRQVRLITPLEWLTKSEVIRVGNALNIPWSLTWSCYKGEELHCGVCPTCRARQDAFAAASTLDPTHYRRDPTETDYTPAVPPDLYAAGDVEHD